MGYELCITRAATDPSSEIGLDEWLALVDADPDLTRQGDATATSPSGDTITYRSDGLAVWTGHSQHDDGLEVWFDHRRGAIHVGRPDDEVIAKMVELARRLDARVQGEEGEFYGEVGH